MRYAMSKEEFKRYLEEICEEDEERIQRLWYVLGYIVWIAIIMIVLFV